MFYDKHLTYLPGFLLPGVTRLLIRYLIRGIKKNPTTFRLVIIIRKNVNKRVFVAFALFE